MGRLAAALLLIASVVGAADAQETLLLIPPVKESFASREFGYVSAPDTSRPLREWRLSDKYLEPMSCEAAREARIDSARRASERYFDGQRRILRAEIPVAKAAGEEFARWRHALCVAASDPRLVILLGRRWFLMSPPVQFHGKVSDIATAKMMVATDAPMNEWEAQLFESAEACEAKLSAERRSREEHYRKTKHDLGETDPITSNMAALVLVIDSAKCIASDDPRVR